MKVRLPWGAQPLQPRPQRIEGGDVLLQFSQLEIRRHHAGILAQHQLGLPAEHLGAIPHLQRLAPLLGGQRDQLGEVLLERRQRRIHGLKLGRTEFERDEILFHGKAPE